MAGCPTGPRSGRPRAWTTQAHTIFTLACTISPALTPVEGRGGGPDLLSSILVSPRHAALRRGPRPRHAARAPRHAVRHGLALTLAAVLAFGAGGLATAYSQIQGGITSANVEDLLGDRPPAPTADPSDPNTGTPVNVLVMGTDTREGQEAFAPDQANEGQRSDTTILLHISADRSRVELISIPRDSIVDIPQCLRSDGTRSTERPSAIFNSAFSLGGESGEVSDAAACTQKTVEAATGVFIHHFVVIDMTGFVRMVDALGGVPLCIPHDIESPKAQLSLDAGNHVLDGRTALGYARARTGEGLGDGSDLGRIERQQQLLGATARTVLSKNLLTDVPELIRFLNATTRSLTVSSQIAAIPDAAGLAFSLRSVPAGNITFATVPTRPAPSDPNRVVWTQDADELWQRIIQDRPIAYVGEPAEQPADGATGAPSPTAPSVPEPSATATPRPGSSPTPTPTRTSLPGVDVITPDDVESVCG